ncbi:MAG: peptidyl-alpha-hydroxyglycine alpha-amidating lyase family protein [Vicinamibacterales bacterium]
MKHGHLWWPLAAVAIAGLALATAQPHAQAQPTPNAKNDLPNPYRTIEGWAKLPEGRTWGSTSSVDIDKDGTSVWVGERCGTNSCLTSTLDPVLKFDSTGKLVKSFGSGLVVFPHGITVDRDGNIWIVDGNDNAPRPARGAAPAPGATPAPLPMGPPAGGSKGHQVIKFSPDGKVLMTLGKPGGAAAPDYFFQPNDVLVAPNGDIFVGEGHGGGNSRMFKFDKTGKLLTTWGKLGSAQGDFSQPHALAMDSQGRLFVADRSNNRVQVFDQNGKFLAETRAFGRPSGVYIDKNDNLFVADSESQSRDANAYGYNPGVKRGIRFGSAKTLTPAGFIPDPSDGSGATSAAEGVAVDSNGVVYGAEVGPRALKRYVKQ